MRRSGDSRAPHSFPSHPMILRAVTTLMTLLLLSAPVMQSAEAVVHGGGGSGAGGPAGVLADANCGSADASSCEGESPAVPHCPWMPLGGAAPCAGAALPADASLRWTPSDEGPLPSTPPALRPEPPFLTSILRPPIA